MDRKVRGKRANQPADPDILHDGGVDPGRDHAAQVILGLGEFIREDERVEGDVAAHSPPVEIVHELRQVGLR